MRIADRTVYIGVLIFRVNTTNRQNCIYIVIFKFLIAPELPIYLCDLLVHCNIVMGHHWPTLYVWFYTYCWNNKIIFFFITFLFLSWIHLAVSCFISVDISTRARSEHWLNSTGGWWRSWCSNWWWWVSELDSNRGCEEEVRRKESSIQPMRGKRLEVRAELVGQSVHKRKKSRCF